MLGFSLVFATEVPSSTVCTASGSGWIMAVSATTNTVGGTNNFFADSPGVSGIQSTVGVIQGITVLSDPTNKQDHFLAGGTGGVQAGATKVNTLTGRISWHELVR